MMTREDLRDARMAEARRLTLAEGEENLNPLCVEAFANHLYDLIEQDWRPEPEVDAVTLAAHASANALTRQQTGSYGAWTRGAWVDAFRAGHAHAQANCADVRRMDWLERGQIKVWRPEDIDPAISHIWKPGCDPLRTKIDRAMEQPS